MSEKKGVGRVLRVMARLAAYRAWSELRVLLFGRRLKRILEK